MEKKHENKEDYWRKHIREQKDSGLSIREYCELEELAVSTFGYWKKKLDGAQKKNSFIEVQIPHGRSNSFIHIRLCGGTELGIAPGTDVRYIGDLVKTLNHS